MGKKRSSRGKGVEPAKLAPPRKKLLRYLSYAAEITGKAAPGVKPPKCYADGQAFYSLLWYFKHCLSDDLDAGNPTRYCHLLDAFLGADRKDVLKPPMLDPQETAEEDRQLDELFMQSEFPPTASQRLAIHKALHYPVSLIQGPPGTGKTETILRIAGMAVARGWKVAIVSSNEAAVKNIESKLSGTLSPLLDLPPDERSYYLEHDLTCTLATKIACLGSKSRRAMATAPITNENLAFDSKGCDHPFPDGATTSGWEPNKGFDEFTDEFPLITSTIHSLKKCFYDGDEKKYDLVIMDEASQTNLFVGIVAMSCAKSMVIVGDEEQLPPVVTEQSMADFREYARHEDLFKGNDQSPYDMSRDDLSFLTACYQVFSDHNPELKTMLVDHFRCHPAIINFCNENIYDRKLVVRSKPKNANIPCPISIVWYEGDYREGIWLRSESEESPDKKTRTTCVNRKQMTILWREELPRIEQYVRDEKSICILSPFRGQIVLLKGVVKQALKHVNLETAVEYETTDGEEAEAGQERLYALTIHKSQGQEFDIVYLLPVEDGNWEWPWSQGRRLVNVAASRAKEELRIILSTKLMEKDTQKRLTGGRVARVKKPAKNSDDVKNQEMYVRKLVEYTYGLLESLDESSRKVQEAHPEFGIRRTNIRSIFDEIPYLQQPGSKGDSAPERCVERALAEIPRTGLAFAHNVSFDLMTRDGSTVSELCEGGYEHPSEAHFDFVVFDVETRRVLLAIEVDGARHRFKKTKGHRDHTQEDMDHRKNLVARGVCGATLAHLSRSRRWPVINDEADFPVAGSDDSVQGDEGVDKSFIWKKSDVPRESTFVFLRIPSDGTTYGETNELSCEIQKSPGPKRTGNPPTTIEDYIDKQVALSKEQGDAWCGLTVSDKVKAIPMKPSLEELSSDPPRNESGRQERGIAITKLLEQLQADPETAPLVDDMDVVAMNRLLVERGFQKLEDGNFSRRVPTEKGKAIGILTAHLPSDDSTLYPTYTKRAQDYIREHLEEIRNGESPELIQPAHDVNGI